MFAILLLLSTGPMVEPECDAQIVARYVPTLTQEEQVEVINTLEQGGTLTAESAQAYLRLIEEAYRTQDLKEWAKAKCEAVES